MLLQQLMYDVQGILKPSFTAQKQSQRHIGVHARFPTRFAGLRQVLQPFVLVAVDSTNASHYPDRQRQVRNDVIVNAHHRLGISKIWIQFQHFFMVGAGTQGVA